MLKFLKKNQKKALAILCVVGMVSFIYGLVPHGNANGFVDVPAGTLDGTKIVMSQINTARDEFQAINLMRYIDPDEPQQQQIPLLAEKIGQAAAGEIAKNPATFFLLVQEANKHGCTPSDEEVTTFLRSHVGNIPVNYDEDRTQQAITDLLAVDNWLNMVSENIKVTRPLRALAIAHEFQNVTINFASFAAKGYLANVPTPTDQQINQQYALYQSLLPGGYGTAADPLGFGYKIPDRYKIQYIGVTHDEARAAAVKSRSEQDWYVQAFGEFQSNRSYFDSKPLPATTQPTAQASTAPSSSAQIPATQPDSAQTAATPATSPSTQPAVAQAPAAAPPTTRRVENLDEDFALHAPLVLDYLYDQETDKIEQQIIKKISDALSAGYGSYRDAMSAGGAATRNSASSPYLNFTYIADLMKSVETQFGVTLTRGDIDQFKTRQELSDLGNIGQTFTYFGQQEARFADLVPTMALWQPSPPMTGPRRDAFVFRVSGIDAAHSLPLDEVKDRVINDWKIAAAFEQAKTAANTLLTAAQSQGLRPAAAAAGANVSTTESFSPIAVMDPRRVPSIPPLNLNPDSLRFLAQASEHLISTPPAASGRPVDLALLYPDASVMVIELNSAIPLFGAESNGRIEASTAYQLRTQELNQFLPKFCAYEAVAQRLNFKPDINLRMNQ